MSLNHLVIALSLLMVVSVPAILWLAPDPPSPAPELTVSTLHGEQLRIGGRQDGPVLVSFWASTCGSCIEEIPQLVRLHEDFAPFGLQVIAIAMAYDPPNRVVELSRVMQLPYAVALDIDGEAAQAFGAFVVELYNGSQRCAWARVRFEGDAGAFYEEVFPLPPGGWTAARVVLGAAAGRYYLKTSGSGGNLRFDAKPKLDLALVKEVDITLDAPAACEARVGRAWLEARKE